ncbi:MAG TPA: alanine--tRNA ligase [Chloroflexi bacterium]|nr:alanine--tRNA ligase [Chloroflexota bacterium]HAF19866.1 alanine--tRNA ligase [Chloroflexota bacterium]
MRPVTGNEIRTRFLEHFASREHLVLPSAPLVPRGDPSTLFISAGMQPLQPYYLGLSKPPAPRLATVQKCFRAVDIDEVGDRTHTTMFEMMGNFAPTGAYFKETAIPLAWELVHEKFKLPVNRLRVTVHPTDAEALQLWTEKIGIPADRIHQMESNWWGLGRGPCGPDSEIFYDLGREVGCGLPDCWPDHCDRYLEIWNLVFPQFDQQEDGTLVPLPRPAIDTGSGLERTAAALQGVQDVFTTDLYAPIIGFVREHSARDELRSERIVTDHLRAMTFIIGDGVVPSNEGRGYVLRRVIRRALVHARKLEMKRPLADAVAITTGLFGEPYPELKQQTAAIAEVIRGESERFQKTLEQGMEQFEKVASRGSKIVSGADAFRLHDTFGFPFELTRELARDRGLDIDEEGFKSEMAAQRERSRRAMPHQWALVKDLPKSEFTGYTELTTESKVVGIRKGGGPADVASEGEAIEVFLDRTPFYAESGGQVGDTGTITTESGRLRVEDTQKPADGVIAHLGAVVTGELRVGEAATAAVDAPRRRQIARHHSATHLLHKALREVLGDHVQQKGSWVGPEHTTFDIPLNRAITDKELERVNRRVMEKVREALPFHESHKPYKDAVAQGAMHLFDEKYGDVVRVVCFGDWTCELCGGTHVASTADIGPAVIVSESSIGSGLRRIDMVVGEAADDLIWRERRLLSELARSFNTGPEHLPERVESLRGQLKDAERRLKALSEQLRSARVKGQGGNGLVIKKGKVPFVTETVEASTPDELAAYADRYLEMVESGVVTVVAGDQFVIKVSKDLTPEYNAARLASLLGKGGGQAHLARGKLDVPAAEAFERLERELS